MVETQLPFNHLYPPPNLKNHKSQQLYDRPVWHSKERNSKQTLNGQQILHKRGIPGVSSDIFHLGFFEDSTAHNSDPVIHTEYDALIDALTFFAMILALYVLLTGLVFGIREYSFAMKKRKKQLISDVNWTAEQAVEIPLKDTLNSNLMPPAVEYNISRHKLTNRAYPEINNKNSSEPQTDLSQSAKDSDENEISNNYNSDSAGIKYDSDFKPFEPFAPIEVVKISGELTPYTDDDYCLASAGQDGTLRRPFYETRPKAVYSIKEIFALKPAEYKGIPLLKSHLERAYDNQLTARNLKQALSLTFPMTRIAFDGAWAAEKEISDLSLYITNEIPSNGLVLNAVPISKRLALFRFVAVGVNSTTFRNPNIFLASFNNTMDGLIDTGIIFDILDDSNAYNARVLIEMILQYCYAHWFYDPSSSGKIFYLTKQFTQWKLASPLVQPHHVIFRYLINMNLGMHTVSNLDNETAMLSTSKVNFMMVYAIENSNCYDYIGILPLLSQAIEFSENEDNQILFYRCLYLLIKKHSHCCMDHGFFTGSGLLKGLIQSGLYYLNPRQIKRHTSDILSILLGIDPKFKSWSSEVKGGQAMLPTTPKLGFSSEFARLSNIIPREIAPDPESTTSTDTNTNTNTNTRATETWSGRPTESLDNRERGYTNTNMNTNHISPRATPGYFF